MYGVWKAVCSVWGAVCGVCSTYHPHPTPPQHTQIHKYTRIPERTPLALRGPTTANIDVALCSSSASFEFFPALSPPIVIVLQITGQPLYGVCLTLWLELDPQKLGVVKMVSRVCLPFCPSVRPSVCHDPLSASSPSSFSDRLWSFATFTDSVCACALGLPPPNH